MDAGSLDVGGALIDGTEPGFPWPDESPETYTLTVYIPVFDIPLDPDRLSAEIVDDERPGSSLSVVA
ncbi:MAG TPA: hypothetical protein VEF89_04700 [Solirubrobacteraceae bacterium]|nr:hypothetical protein [Solirubrobacteraceae bacterium]